MLSITILPRCYGLKIKKPFLKSCPTTSNWKGFKYTSSIPLQLPYSANSTRSLIQFLIATILSQIALGEQSQRGLAFLAIGTAGTEDMDADSSTTSWSWSSSWTQQTEEEHRWQQQMAQQNLCSRVNSASSDSSSSEKSEASLPASEALSPLWKPDFRRWRWYWSSRRTVTRLCSDLDM